MSSLDATWKGLKEKKKNRKKGKGNGVSFPAFFYFPHYNMPGDFSTIEKEAKEKRSTLYISILEKRAKRNCQL